MRRVPDDRLYGAKYFLSSQEFGEEEYIFARDLGIDPQPETGYPLPVYIANLAAQVNEVNEARARSEK